MSIRIFRRTCVVAEQFHDSFSGIVPTLSNQKKGIGLSAYYQYLRTQDRLNPHPRAVSEEVAITAHRLGGPSETPYLF